MATAINSIDITSLPVRYPQFDTDRPVTRLEALLHGDSEIAAEDFVEWLCGEGQSERLYHIIIDRLDAEDVRAAAEAWAKEADHG